MSQSADNRFTKSSRRADWSRLSSGWHTFSLNWTPTRMTWFADGREVFVITKRVPHQPMYLIANVADYDMSLPGSCSGEMAIRSVQVWQL